VLDQHGAPVTRADIWRAGGDAQSTPTDRDGAFVLQLPPADACELHVEPPQPNTGWAGGLAHVVEPGQTAVTLVLRRRPVGRAELEVELVDAGGRPLEPRRTALTRRGDGDSTWHPATGVIGRVTARDLAPGAWTLRVEPTRGCELAADFTVATDGEVVRLTLTQPNAGTVHGEITFGDGAARGSPVELGTAPGSAAARFVAGAGQQLLLRGQRLRLDPAAGLAFTVEDVDPSRPLALTAESDGAGGDAEVRVAAGGTASVRVVLRPRGRLLIRSRAPFVGDGLSFQLRRPGGEWGELVRCAGLAGRTELWSAPMSTGAWEWRLRLPTRGGDNRGGADWLDGVVAVGADTAGVIELPGG
jgi:hypothetical protein